MRALLLIVALVALPGAVAAQEADAGSAAARVHEERPPEGSLRRGLLAAPEWSVTLFGALAAAGAAAALAYRVARSRRR